MLVTTLAVGVLFASLSSQHPSQSRLNSNPEVQSDQPQDGVFLLKGVRIVQPDGTPAPAQDLLIQDGQLLPGDTPGAAPSRIIEAEDDWLVYPGMSHASFPVKFAETPDSPYQTRVTDPATGPLPAMEDGDRGWMRGWLHASDILKWDASSGDDWRQHGFTSAHLLPSQGIIRGHAAWLSLNGLPLGEALLERGGRQVFSLRNQLSRGYPRTPMSALAVLRQAALDEELATRFQRYQNADLADLANGIYLANSTREIENILDLLRDYRNNEDAIIFGGRDAWKHAERLREQNVGVIFVLDLEDEPKSDEKLKLASEQERPYWQPPAALRREQERLHRDKVSAFRKLREAGVRCALCPSGSLKKMKSALKQLRADGLSDFELYQAMSSDVVELIGAPQWRQQAADLIISRGSLDVVDPDLAWVFADGRGWSIAAADDEKDDASDEDDDEEADNQGIAGDWEIHLSTPMGEQEFGFSIDPDSNSIDLFDLSDPYAKESARGIEISGNKVGFSFTPPDMPMEMRAELVIEGDSGSGTITAFGRDMPCEIVRIIEEEDDETKPDDADEDDVPDSELGHPAWPIETPANRIPAHDLDGTVLLKGGMLYPMTGAEPFIGDLFISDGRISVVGGDIHTSVEVPTFDASGWHITPGIIDPHSHLALDSINEGSVAISAECTVGDMIHPESVSIYRAAAGGTTVVQSLHGSANPIGGRAAVWELDYRETSIAGLKLPGAPQGIKFALGENVKQSNSDSNSGKRFPNSRSGVQAVYRRAFTAAIDYSKRRSLAAAGNLPSFRQDVRLEVLADILDGRIHIQCHSYRADELLMFLGICEEFGIRNPTFQHVLEGYKVAPEIAAFGAMASTFADWWAYKFEVYDAIPWNPAMLTKAGVITTINSDSDELIRHLNTEAGKSLRYGELSVNQCLELCTLNGARQLHVEDRLGSLEVGKDGTISVFDGHPLSTWSRCLMTIARGRSLFELAADNDQKWEQYQEEVRSFAIKLAAATAAAEQTDPAELADADNNPTVTDPADWEAWTRNGLGHSALIENGTIHTPGEANYQASLLLVDGLIKWIGDGAVPELPAGCARIDASGLHLYPTFIDAGDHVGVLEIERVRSSRDDREAGRDHPDLSVAAAIHSDSRHIRPLRMNGVGHVLTTMSSGRIRGQATLIQLDGDTTTEMNIVPDLAMHISFPGVRAPKPGKSPEEPKELEELNRWFDDAIAYGERMDTAGSAGVETRSLQLEALLPYARGEKPILIEANAPLTIMAARAWCKERGLDPIYLGAKQAWKVAGFLGADRAKVLTGSVHSLPRKDTDPFDSAYRNAKILVAAGCVLGLRNEDTQVARNLPFQAATAGVNGLNQDGALHALTLGPATVLGIDRFTGSLEVGKAANLFISAGDPFDNSGKVVRMWLGGRELDLSSNQTRLRDRYMERIIGQNR